MRMNKYLSGQDVYLVATVAAELFGMEFLYFYVTKPYLADGGRLFFEPTSATTTTAAIVASAAALLLSGVIIMAPLLSLSLHQSYDTIFELRKYLIADSIGHSNTPQRAAIILDAETRLRQQLRYYAALNPLYLGTWITAVAMLLGSCFILSPTRYSISAAESFYLSLSFMFSSCIITVIFSIVSLAFFTLTRPGITKLSLFVQFFDAEESVK